MCLCSIGMLMGRSGKCINVAYLSENGELKKYGSTRSHGICVTDTPIS